MKLAIAQMREHPRAVLFYDSQLLQTIRLSHRHLKT